MVCSYHDILLIFQVEYVFFLTTEVVLNLEKEGKKEKQWSKSVGEILRKFSSYFLHGEKRHTLSTKLAYEVNGRKKRL